MTIDTKEFRDLLLNYSFGNFENDANPADELIAHIDAQISAARAAALEEAARVVDRRYISDNSEEEWEVNRILSSRAARIRQVIASQQAAPTQAAPNVQATLDRVALDAVRLDIGKYRRTRDESWLDLAVSTIDERLSGREPAPSEQDELPPLPEGDEFSATRMLADGTLAPRYTAASMRGFGHACYAMGRAAQGASGAQGEPVQPISIETSHDGVSEVTRTKYRLCTCTAASSASGAPLSGKQMFDIAALYFAWNAASWHEATQATTTMQGLLNYTRAVIDASGAQGERCPHGVWAADHCYQCATPSAQASAAQAKPVVAVGVIYQVRNGRGVWSDVDAEIYDQYRGRSYERRIVYAAPSAPAVRAVSHENPGHKDCYCGGWTDSTGDFHNHGCPELAAPVVRPKLTVWEGSMPESNGKSNFTAVLCREDSKGFDRFTDGFQLARSEYPDRVRYDADFMRWLIGERETKPEVWDDYYDMDKHSGYVKPAAPAVRADVPDERNVKELLDALDAMDKLRLKIRSAGRPPHTDYWHQEIDEHEQRIANARAMLAASPSPQPVAAWTKERVTDLAKQLAEASAMNAGVVPQVIFPHIYLGLLDALLDQPVSQINYKAWYDAVVDACVVAGELPWDDADPRGTVSKLLAWHEDVALDPAVSERAAKLAGAASVSQVVEPSADARDAGELVQLRAQNMLLVGLYDAVTKLVKAKGRFHTEQNYMQVVAAYDLVRTVDRAAMSAQQGQKGGKGGGDD